MPNRKNTSSANELMPKSGVATSRHRNATKMNISAMNIGLRPNRSASPPRESAPIRMPNEARGADEAVLRGADVEFDRDQRQRDAGHEHHKAFEEFSGGGEGEDAPLHRGHRRHPDRGAVGPDRPLVDIGLDRFSGRRLYRFRSFAGARVVHGFVPRRIRAVQRAPSLPGEAGEGGRER